MISVQRGCLSIMRRSRYQRFERNHWLSGRLKKIATIQKGRSCTYYEIVLADGYSLYHKRDMGRYGVQYLECNKKIWEYVCMCGL